MLQDERRAYDLTLSPNYMYFLNELQAFSEQTTPLSHRYFIQSFILFGLHIFLVTIWFWHGQFLLRPHWKEPAQTNWFTAVMIYWSDTQYVLSVLSVPGLSICVWSISQRIVTLASLMSPISLDILSRTYSSCSTPSFSTWTIRGWTCVSFFACCFVNEGYGENIKVKHTLGQPECKIELAHSLCINSFRTLQTQLTMTASSLILLGSSVLFRAVVAALNWSQASARLTVIPI